MSSAIRESMRTLRQVGDTLALCISTMQTVLVLANEEMAKIEREYAKMETVGGGESVVKK